MENIDIQFTETPKSTNRNSEKIIISEDGEMIGTIEKVFDNYSEACYLVHETKYGGYICRDNLENVKNQIIERIHGRREQREKRLEALEQNKQNRQSGITINR